MSIDPLIKTIMMVSIVMSGFAFAVYAFWIRADDR